MDRILQRFAGTTKSRYRQDTETAASYSRAFRRFAEAAGLESYNRKQLTPTRSHKLLMDFLNSLPEKSRRWNIAALRAVWVAGLRLPWPVDVQRDFGRTLPPIEPRLAPNDADLKPLAEALEREPSAYMRAFVRMVLTYGPRPVDQLGALRWDNVWCDPNGRPYAIVALGIREGFKTRSPWVAHIPASLAEDILAWRQEAPGSTPEALLFPRRSKPGYIRDPHRRHSKGSARALWDDYKDRHGIRSGVTMAHVRHWVKRRGRKRFGDKLAPIAFWQGHKPEGGGMAGHYGTNLPVEEVLDEQAREWPDGPLGHLMPPRMTHEPGLPEEAVKALTGYLSGALDALEVMETLRALKKRLPVAPNLLRP